METLRYEQLLDMHYLYQKGEESHQIFSKKIKEMLTLSMSEMRLLTELLISYGPVGYNLKKMGKN